MNTKAQSLYDEVFQRYRDFRPTGLDPRGLNADSLGIRDWFVMPVKRTRDSGVLTESNFETFLAGLGGESGWVEIHRFGHWGPGWFELILVKPTAKKTLERAYEMTGALEDYPVLDEKDWSKREWEAICDCWESMSLQDRIDECAHEGESIFAARRDYPPERVEQMLREYVNR